MMSAKKLSVLFIAVIAAGVALGLLVAKSNRELFAELCKARWKDSGMRAEVRPMVGCMVMRADGTWVPEGAIRVSDK